ncbi:phycobilisome rod-core linker polypeptide [Leptolyngbya iicbica]|uniref:Phycobilisome rod-core linker polypeptide CpcG n=2 Tax=Cyanophyceae TaxID=3028117 RepID=A0A4Q7EDU6_9CYAN|nr:phycobilisome rod-core linker polypeptide [Leptolyngbya sp. LK]RZM81964.1 phycobilisome rod-core linker polypeptide CpcG [Leptolyngbya sp. LK]
MVLQQLTYAPSSQNQRVKNFEVPGDEYPRMFSGDNLLDDNGEVQDLISAAYRQIFNEQQLLASNRLPKLESQLKMGQITVKEFVRGLLLSSTFRERNFDANNNYRFARMCLQRVLGREPYSDREILSWSIVIGTKGLVGFVNGLLESQEYLDNFGEHIVPYQRRRILPQRPQGDVTFAHMPRYAEDHLAQLKALGYDFDRDHVPGGYRWSSQPSPVRWQWQKPPYSPVVRRIGAGITIFGASAIGLILAAVILSWFGWLHI